MINPIEDLIRITLVDLTEEVPSVPDLTQPAFDRARRHRTTMSLIGAAGLTAAVLIGTPLAYAATSGSHSPQTAAHQGATPSPTKPSGAPTPSPSGTHGGCPTPTAPPTFGPAPSVTPSGTWAPAPKSRSGGVTSSSSKARNDTGRHSPPPPHPSPSASVCPDPTPTAPPTSGPVPSAPPTFGPARCHTSDLSASFAGTSGFHGGGSQNLVLTNKSQRPCRLYGNPGMLLIDAHGNALPTRVTRVGKRVGITIQPGQSGYAKVTSWVIPTSADNGAPCNPPAAGVLITPPDETSQLKVMGDWQVCDGGHIEIGAVVANAPVPLTR